MTRRRLADFAFFADFADLGSAILASKTRSREKTSAKTAKTAETVDWDSPLVLGKWEGARNAGWGFPVGGGFGEKRRATPPKGGGWSPLPGGKWMIRKELRVDMVDICQQD